MQGQRNSMEHYSDVFGFDIGSSSGNPVMDQQAYWNNVLGSVESQNLQGYQLNHSDPTIPYGNEPQQDGTFLGFWESGEASSSGSALNYSSSSNVKTEHLNIGGGLRIGERRLVADSDLSLDVDINLNANVNDLCGQSSNVNCASQGPGQYSVCDRNVINAPPPDLRLHPYRTFLLGAEQTDSFTLNPSENPLGDFSLMQEGIGQRPGSSLDGRRLACKRKNIEGANGQSSAGASTSFSHRNDNALNNIASSSYNPAPIRNSSSPNCLLVPSSIEDQLPRYGTNAGLSSGSFDLNGGINNAGNSQRSFRARTTTAQQIAPCSVWPSSNAIRLSNSWNHPPPQLQSAFDDPQEVIPVVSSLNLQYQHPANVPGVPQVANRFTGHGASSSRTGSMENRIIGSEEVPRRNVVPTNYTDLVPPAAVDLRRLVPEPSNWSSDGRGTAISGTIPPVSRANTNSTVNPPTGFTHQNVNRRHPRNLSEEIGRLSGALRGHQPPRLRSGFLLERQGDGVWGVPLSMRGREGRRLMEIRNALEMIHRGENVRLESIFYGGVEIHDRHRDMRFKPAGLFRHPDFLLPLLPHPLIASGSAPQQPHTSASPIRVAVLARMEQTFIMIKPDGVQRGLIGDIISRFEKKGFYLKGMKFMNVERSFAQQHYADLSDKPFFAGLVEYIISGPVVAMVWEGKDVVLTGRRIIGATRPWEAAPGTIRGDYAVEVGRNVIHGSDSVENGKKEIALWFPEGPAEWRSNLHPWIYEA